MSALLFGQDDGALGPDDAWLSALRCRGCERGFNERTGSVLNRLQLPTDVVFLIVLWRLRMKLSLRDLAEILLLRGLVFSHKAIRDWEARLAPLLTDALRQRRKGKAGRSWYVDETYIKVAGQWQYLYRAIDRDGNLVDDSLSKARDQKPRSILPLCRHGDRNDTGQGHHRPAHQLPAGPGRGLLR